MEISPVLWFESEMSPSIRHLHISSYWVLLLGKTGLMTLVGGSIHWVDFETASLGYFHFSVSASFLHPNVEAINFLLLMPCLLLTAKLPCHDILLCIWDYMPK